MKNEEENQDIQRIVNENFHLLEDVSSNLLQLQSNFHDFLRNFDLLRKTTDQCKKIETLQVEVEKLKDNLTYTLEPFWQQIKNDMFDLKDHIKEQEDELQRVRTDYQTQIKDLENAQNEVHIIKDACNSQSSYITTLSSTFGSLLWNASKELRVVQCISTGDKFTDFLRIVTNSVRTFFEVYSSNFADAEEQKYFIVKFVGIISNVAASTEGRNVLVSTCEGKQLINEILNVVTKIPTDEITLQKIVLIALFNISINKDGLLLIENNSNLLNTISQGIINGNELMYISLKLLQSITYETDNEHILDFVRNEISIKKLDELGGSSSPLIQDVIRHIQDNLQYEKENLL